MRFRSATVYLEPQSVFGHYCLNQVVNNDKLSSQPSGKWSLVLESADTGFSLIHNRSRPEYFIKSRDAWH